MRHLVKCILALALLALARPAVAQGMAELPVFFELAKMPDGSFSKYAVKLPDGTPVELEVSLVGREAGAHWVEWAMNIPGKGEMAIKMLVAEDVKRMLLQRPGMPQPMEIPPKGAMGGAPRVTRPDPAHLVGEETIKTAAGSFKAKHYRRKEKTPEGEAVIDVWAAQGAPPLGLVKMSQTLGKQTTSMEVVATGKGAKSRITGTPVKPGAAAPPPAKK